MHTTAGLQLLNIIDDGSDECVWMDKAVAAIEAEAATLATTPDALDVERWYRAFATVSGLEAATPEGRRDIYDMFAAALVATEGADRE